MPPALVKNTKGTYVLLLLNTFRNAFAAPLIAVPLVAMTPSISEAIAGIERLNIYFI